MAGGIAVRVQHAVAAVRALPGERELRPFAVELRAPGDQLLDRARPFFHQGPHRRAVAKAVARVERVLLVEFHFVVVAQGHRNPALGVFGGRLLKALLGQHEDTPCFRQFDGGTQPRDACSNHQKIRIHRLLRS